MAGLSLALLSRTLRRPRRFRPHDRLDAPRGGLDNATARKAPVVGDGHGVESERGALVGELVMRPSPSKQAELGVKVQVDEVIRGDGSREVSLVALGPHAPRYLFPGRLSVPCSRAEPETAAGRQLPEAGPRSRSRRRPRSHRRGARSNGGPWPRLSAPRRAHARSRVCPAAPDALGSSRTIDRPASS